MPQRWEDNDDGGSTEEAEVIAPSSDEWMFSKLHGVSARDVDYDELAASIVEDEYRGIADVIKAMAIQHPDAMWFVRSWDVETSASD